MKTKKTIVICASASLYKNIIPLETELKKIGFEVVIPITARKMKKLNDFTVNKSWKKNPNDYDKKRKLMNAHFREIKKSDAILVANFDKGTKKNYIGGNVFMEITIAYYLKKKIFILNSLENNSPIEEEILGVNPVFLDGVIKNLKI